MLLEIKKILKNEDGIGLVEVLASLAIAIIVITSLVSLSLFSVRTSVQSNLVLEATKLGNSQMELFRAYRDSLDSWNTFLSNTASCQASSCYINTSLQVVAGQGVYSTTSTSTLDDINYRLSYTRATEDVLNVTVTVSWREAGGTKSTNFYTTLTNWKQQ